MKEVYVSWSEGLARSAEALGILRKSGVVSGVELSNTDEQPSMIQEAGLKVSCHTPNSALNLASPAFMEAFEGDEGNRALHVVRQSDARTVGVHLGYSAESIIKLRASACIPVEGALLHDRGVLMERIAGNVVLLERGINYGMTDGSRKRVVLENLAWVRDSGIPWGMQSDEIRQMQDEITERIKRYGRNAGLVHVTEPDFAGDVLDFASSRSTVPPGLLIDISHAFISHDAKKHDGLFSRDAGDYLSDMLRAGNGRTYHLHLNCPAGDGVSGYADCHRPFKEGDATSEKILELASMAINESPEIYALTLEMETNLPPAEHAAEMVRQAEYVCKRLNI